MMGRVALLVVLSAAGFVAADGPAWLTCEGRAPFFPLCGAFGEIPAWTTGYRFLAFADETFTGVVTVELWDHWDEHASFAGGARCTFVAGVEVHCANRLLGAARVGDPVFLRGEADGVGPWSVAVEFS